jgi:hypothetical protein
MANIDRIVNVTISLQTVGITQETFSDLLLFGVFTPPSGSGTNVVFIITDPDDLINIYGCLPTSQIYLAAQTFFSQIPHPPQLYIGLDKGSIPTDLVNIINQNNNWYGICDVKHDESRAVSIAAWVEAQEKLFVTVLSNPNNTNAPGTDTTSTAYHLMNGNYFRTAWWYNTDPLQFPDVGIAAVSFTKNPGQETWANQQLAGVNSLNMIEGNAQNVFAKNGNTFEPFRNISITQNGQVAGGEWIDVIRFRDWLCEEIKVTIFQQMVNNRIPYTDPGIAIIRSRLQQALDMGVARGGLAPKEVDSNGNLMPSYTIQVPLSANIPSNIKASRILQDVYFTARLAGAIHVVTIMGTLTYENLPVASAA